MSAAAVHVSAPEAIAKTGSPAGRTGRGPRVVLVAIIAVAALVRLWGLGSQPILYFDSGVYLGEGAFVASAAQRAASALLSGGAGTPLERVAQATANGTDAHPPDIAKPGHAILLAIAFLLLGKTALAGGLVSALAGIGTVVATYAIGLRGWGPRVALPAAALLAISGQHLVYSREPLVEADGLLFATLASLVFLSARGLCGLLAAGVLWGLAFTCNNRLSYLPAIFVIAELADWPGWRGLARRGLVAALGFLAPLAAIEGAYLLARGIGRAAGVATDWLDYAQQLVAFTRMNPPDRVRLDEWPTYFVDLALMDGVPMLALLMVGIGVLVWRVRRGPRSRADLLLAGSLLVPLALYSVYSTGEVRLRHFSLAIPWVMLAAALGLGGLVQLLATGWSRLRTTRPPARGLVLGGATPGDVVSQPRPGRAWTAPVNRNWLLGSAVGALMLAAVPRVVALVGAPSGMATVVGALGTGAVASTNGPVLSFYIGEGRTNARLREAFINVPDDLVALAPRYPTLVVDMQAEVFAGELTAAYGRATPRLVVANGSDAWYLADLLEHFGMPWGAWDDLLAKWAANRGDAAELRVYDTAQVVAALRGQSASVAMPADARADEADLGATDPARQGGPVGAIRSLAAAAISGDVATAGR